jgi:hypothetical protein
MLRYYTRLDTSKLYGATIPDASGAEPLASRIWC